MWKIFEHRNISKLLASSPIEVQRKYENAPVNSTVMFKRLSQLICIIIFIVGDGAYALQCGQPEPERIVTDFDIVFVAFVSKAYFVEGENVEDCGWVEGYFEVVESLKGNPELVNFVRKRLVNCGNSRIGGASDRFPIGKYILVTTNSEVANIGQCTPVWDDYEPPCFIDNIRRQLSTDATNAKVREGCLKGENPRGERSRIKSLRMELTQLENESESISMEMKELKDKLSEAELGEPPE